MWSNLIMAQAALAAITPLASRNPAYILHGNRDIAKSSSSTLFTCPATSWPASPNAIGKANEPQTPSADLASMLAEIDPSRIKATIQKLVSFGTRHTLSTQTSPTRGIGAARDWIHSEYQRYADASDGRLHVETIGYDQEPDGNRVPFRVRISDVVATLSGRGSGNVTENRLYVISGHYDTRKSDVMDYEGDAPGADDDASGVAVAMEIARVMSNPKYPRPRANIAFAAVAGEEQGLYGAQFLAQSYANSTPRVNVEGMLNNDIVGSPKGDDGISDPYIIRLFAQGLPPLTAESSSIREQRLQIGGENDSPARNLARFIREVSSNSHTSMNISVQYRLDRYLRSGDHRPFLESGYPAVRFTEPNEDYAHQHQDVRIDASSGKQYGDLLEFCDVEYIARVARVNAAALWSLAQSAGMPRNVRVNTTALSNDSVFYWDPPATGEGGVAAYEVVWRATAAPFWTDVLDVGRARTATLDLSKDNVVFGVRTRSADGSRGVAVLPFPVA